MNHHSQLRILGAKRLNLTSRCTAFVARKIKPKSGFLTRSRRDLQMTPELCSRFTFSPPFHDIRRNRSRRIPNLPTKFILLALWKELRQSRHIERQSISLLKNQQVLISAYRARAIRLFLQLL